MKTRLVIITAQTVMELFRDYLGPNNVPSSAQLVHLLYSKKEKGKLALVIESEDIPQGARPLQVRFDLRRVYTV